LVEGEYLTASSNDSLTSSFGETEGTYGHLGDDGHADTTIYWNYLLIGDGGNHYDGELIIFAGVEEFGNTGKADGIPVHTGLTQTTEDGLIEHGV
jgi:hypothetical protein